MKKETRKELKATLEKQINLNHLMQSMIFEQMNLRDQAREERDAARECADREEARRVQLESVFRQTSEQYMQRIDERDQARARIDHALDVIAEYGMIDGDHHKQWVLDQVLRVLLDEGYDARIAGHNQPGYDAWDTGIAP